jgi:hypothetical protein
MLLGIQRFMDEGQDQFVDFKFTVCHNKRHKPWGRELAKGTQNDGRIILRLLGQIRKLKALMDWILDARLLLTVFYHRYCTDVPKKQTIQYGTEVVTQDVRTTYVQHKPPSATRPKV